MTFWHSARMPDQHSLVTQGTADRDWLQDGATHYRELAHWLRGIAAGCRLPTAKRELIRLASRYNLRAEQFELRAPRRAHTGDRLGEVRLPQLADAEDYRELARELRVLAERCRFPRGQLELVQLAIKFEQRAERIEKNSRS